jgi:adenylate cyclase, class 2
VRRRHHESNVLYDFFDGRLRATDSVVRIRSTEAPGVLTFKGPKSVVGGVRSREEIETVVEDVSALSTILARLGLVPAFRYEKYREVWSWKGLEIVVDEMPIGVFLEVEGDEEGIQQAAAALGFSAADFIAESYMGLFLAGGGLGDMLFP